MFKPTLIALAAAALTLSSFAAPAQQPRPGSEVSAATTAASRTLQPNATRFADNLRCMDDLLYRFGVRDVSMMVEEMRDSTNRLGVGTRDMMVSAFSDMTRRSRAVRLTTFGQDTSNAIQLMAAMQRPNDLKVLPQYDIRGSVTQFDEAIVRSDAGLGVSIGTPFTGPLVGARVNRAKQSSVLAFDASVVTTRDMALVPGVTSKNTIVVTREDSGVGDGLAQIQSVGVQFAVGVSRGDGVAQAVRNMVELSAIELTGKLLRLPYWTCLGVDVNDPAVRREMEDWFLSMQGSSELTAFFQEQLRNRRFYDGPADGKSNAADTQALAAYRKGLGLAPEGKLDMELFTAFLLRPVPTPPAEPFAAPKLTTPPAGENGTAPPGPREVDLSVKLAKTRYRAGEPIELTVSVGRPAYVYCYVQSPSNGKIQRIFPNRFMRDPRLEAGKPLELPGPEGFRIAAGAEGVKQQAVGCFAAEKEVYNELPPQLRWGDFEDIRVATFDEIRDAFEKVAKAPVALTGALIEVSAK